MFHYYRLFFLYMILLTRSQHHCQEQCLAVLCDNLSVLCLHRRTSWRRQWHPTPVLLLGKFHGQRSLVGCSPWGREESDMTERLHFHFLLSFIGEGNGNPLQCACLENPRDRVAWWAAIYGVTQSRTRLKRLSSSSSKPTQSKADRQRGPGGSLALWCC